MEVFFININFIDMLNQYLANINILITNLNILYYNLINDDNNFRNTINNYINTISNINKEIGEAIKERGGFILIDNNKIKEISTIKILANKNYSSKEEKGIINNMFNIINNITKQLGEYTLKNREYDIFSIVIEFNKFLNKNIWHLTMEKY